MAQAAWQPPESAQRINSIALCLERLTGLDRPRVAELGPLCGRNISFLAGELGFTVRVDDLSRNLVKDPEATTGRLELSPGSYQAIFIWSLMDHLTPDQSQTLVRRFWEALAPGGLVVAFFGQRLQSPAAVQQFEIVDLNTVSVRETALKAPCRVWANREILEALHPLEATNSFILKSGLREFIFRRPAGRAWPDPEE